MGLVASLLKKYDVIPIFGIVPMINNTFLSSYQVCVCVNSLCIQQHVHTTHMWNTVKEGGRGTGREGIEIGRGRQERQGGRERENSSDTAH